MLTGRYIRITVVLSVCYSIWPSVCSAHFLIWHAQQVAYIYWISWYKEFTFPIHTGAHEMKFMLKYYKKWWRAFWICFIFSGVEKKEGGKKKDGKKDKKEKGYVMFDAEASDEELVVGEDLKWVFLFLVCRSHVHYYRQSHSLKKALEMFIKNCGDF